MENQSPHERCFLNHRVPARKTTLIPGGPSEVPALEYCPARLQIQGDPDDRNPPFVAHLKRSYGRGWLGSTHNGVAYVYRHPWMSLGTVENVRGGGASATQLQDNRAAESHLNDW